MNTLAERYPARTTRRRRIFVVAAILAVVGIGWLVWTATFHANPEVAGKIVAFSTGTSDNAVTGTLVVERRDPSRAATCRVVAQATSFERVGELDVPVPPSSEKLARIEVELRTFKRATTMTLEACHTQ